MMSFPDFEPLDHWVGGGNQNAGASWHIFALRNFTEAHRREEGTKLPQDTAWITTRSNPK